MEKKLISTLIILLCTLVTQAQQLAFPGAEGYAAFATGGRGGKVVHVTNLNASGAGSLADAVSQSGRFVVFDVGGVIDITGSSITIASNVTIAGQTAPGEGITIYGGRVIASKAKNVIIRYIRMRGGKSVNSSKCTLTLDDCENLIMDHCSVSWGPWDNVHIANANNITWQYCINSEGIEPQRFGAITDGTRNWTVHHCLWADNKSRNPKMKCSIQYYNNIVYNYAMGIVGGHSAADNYQDVMNNYFIAGPDGSYKYFDQWTETDHLYSTGNYYDGNCDGVLNGTLITDYNGATPMKQPNFKHSAPMNVETAEEAYKSVADHVGASRVRDIHDKRIIAQLTSLGKQGAFIANEQDVGGIGTVAGGQKPTDTDNDGMPDDWETEHGTNPLKDDANAFTMGNGYTNIENYANSLAQKTTFLMYPVNPTARLTDETTVKLTWTNMEAENATAIVVEMSENGKTFTEIQRLDGAATGTTVSDLTPKKVYFFRMKTIGESAESAYSAVVSVNNEYMLPGRGTPPSTITFIPSTEKAYRIICYATVPYNSSTNINGTAKYLTFNSNGTLGATEVFEWDNPGLLWDITAMEGGFYIQNHSTKQHLTTTNVNISGTERIGATDQPGVFTINFVGNQTPAMSGMSTPVSMYRINSPANKGQQIRARGFGDDWIWGSGTLDRADMIFTFAEIETKLVPLFLGKLSTALETAASLSASAQADVTLGYPAAAIETFRKAVEEAKTFFDKAQQADNITQADVNDATDRLVLAIDELEKQKIYTLTGFDTKMNYNIYSYGTMSNASATTATSDIQRRYLYATKATDGKRDSLVYRIGLNDVQIDAGSRDAVARDKAALWQLEDAGQGMVYVRNQKTGSYMQIDNYLSAEKKAIRPYYAKYDNGKMAFYLDASSEGKPCFNVGNPDADGKGGPLGFFNGHADRTRLRWVIEQTNIPFTDGISQPHTAAPSASQYFNLHGMKLGKRPAHGVYVERIVGSDGNVKTHKAVGK